MVNFMKIVFLGGSPQFEMQYMYPVKLGVEQFKLTLAFTYLNLRVHAEFSYYRKLCLIQQQSICPQFEKQMI